VVEYISQSIAVMYLGKFVELADKHALFTRPQHPYTEALLAAMPVPDPEAARRRIILKGDVPRPINPPWGCRFHTRCPYAFTRCSQEEPEMRVMPSLHVASRKPRPCRRSPFRPSLVDGNYRKRADFGLFGTEAALVKL
jgi:peptide/nickel transport system ATP-binding protein